MISPDNLFIYTHEPLCGKYCEQFTNVQKITCSKYGIYVLDSNIIWYAKNVTGTNNDFVKVKCKKYQNIEFIDVDTNSRPYNTYAVSMNGDLYEIYKASAINLGEHFGDIYRAHYGNIQAVYSSSRKTTLVKKQNEYFIVDHDNLSFGKPLFIADKFFYLSNSGTFMVLNNNDVTFGMVTFMGTLYGSSLDESEKILSNIIHNNIDLFHEIPDGSILSFLDHDNKILSYPNNIDNNIVYMLITTDLNTVAICCKSKNVYIVKDSIAIENEKLKYCNMNNLIHNNNRNKIKNAYSIICDE